MIFGGEAFVDLIGEISLMKDLTKTMDITTKQMEEEEVAEVADAKMKAAAQTTPEKKSVDGRSTPSATPKQNSFTPPEKAVKVEDPPSSKGRESHKLSDPHISGTTSPLGERASSTSGTSTPRRQFGQQVIMEKSEEDSRMDAAGLTAEEKELRKKEKKKGLSKEQREELAAYEAERKKIRDERVDTLAKKLIDRISIWTETDKGIDVTKAFQEKTRLEVENLKMESFGLEILHAIGTTYLQKATSFLKSQKFLGISGFFSRLKDKGTLAKETWNTISTAIDAQMTMEEMAKMEEKGGEDWTDEKKAEYEKRVTGKILAAAWKGSKYEIQGVLRDVCDRVLNDKNVKMEKRIERAHALVIAGTIYQNVSPHHHHQSQIPPFLRISSFTNISFYSRRNVIQTKRVITWPSSNSWPKPRSRKVKTTTKTKIKTRTRIRRRVRKAKSRTNRWVRARAVIGIVCSRIRIRMRRRRQRRHQRHRWVGVVGLAGISFFSRSLSVSGSECVVPAASELESAVTILQSLRLRRVV